MSYSCAYFKNPEDSLYQAQKNKVDYILEKLYLKEGMTLLDIGCGWGFLLIEAAKKYNVHGTGITLSNEQYAEFQQRIEEEGLQNYLCVKLMDYRDLPELGIQFDRVVSVGMVEHVGRENYQLFNDCVSKVLKNGSLYLLHFISALKEHPGDAWIKKYIFPGGVVPSLREMLSCAAEDNFHTIDVENLRLHYNRTLLCWEKNFQEPILTAFGARVNDETFRLSKEYFFWITLGIPFYMFGQAMNPIIRSDGSPNFAMGTLLTGVVLNIIFDPICIYVLKWGMMGAAVATILGQIVSAIMSVVYLARMKSVKMSGDSFKLHASLLKKVLPLGITSFLSQISIVLSMPEVLNMVTKYGALDPIFGQEQYAQIPTAVIGIVMKFFQIIISISVGLAVFRFRDIMLAHSGMIASKG